MGFFNLDGPVYRIGSIIADILILGIFWILLAIPVVTIGASTSAVYYVFTKRVNGREGYLWQDFWRSFRQNFITATAVWLTLLVIFVLLIFNITYAGLLEDMAGIVLAVQFVIFVQTTFVAMYAFPLISRFEMGYREVIKTAFFLANRHILMTISNAVLLAACVLMVFMQPMFIFFMVGVYCYFSSFLIVKAFKKYRPDMDLETNTGEMAPLQLDAIDEKDEDDAGVAVGATPSRPDFDEIQTEQTYYDNNSTVMNLDRLRGMQEDKE